MLGCRIWVFGRVMTTVPGPEPPSPSRRGSLAATTRAAKGGNAAIVRTTLSTQSRDNRKAFSLSTKTSPFNIVRDTIRRAATARADLKRMPRRTFADKPETMAPPAGFNQPLNLSPCSRRGPYEFLGKSNDFQAVHATRRYRRGGQTRDGRMGNGKPWQQKARQMPGFSISVTSYG